MQGLPLLTYVSRPNEETPSRDSRREKRGTRKGRCIKLRYIRGHGETYQRETKIMLNSLLFLFITLETSLMSLLCFCPEHLKRSPANQRQAVDMIFLAVFSLVLWFSLRVQQFLLLLLIVPFLHYVMQNTFFFYINET